MPNVQPTNNPVPSDNPADARDNFKRIDEVVNSTENLTSPTRTGVQLVTLHRYNELVQPNIDGAEAAAISAAASAEAAEASASGLDYQGLWPDAGGSADKGDTYQTQVGGTPTGQYFTALQNTTADPVGDNVNWRIVVSNQSLGALTSYQAANVADIKMGIMNGGVRVDLTQAFEGTRVSWMGYYERSDGGSNWGRIRKGAHTEDRGKIFSIDANTYIEANIVRRSGLVSIYKFGARQKSDDAVIDNAPIINEMLDDEIPVRIPEGLFSIKSPISYTKSASIATYYASVPGSEYPTVVIVGQHKDNSILESDSDSFTGSDYIMQINTNPDNLLTDAYLFNCKLEGFTIRGSGVTTSAQHGLKIRGWWHGSIADFKVHLCLNGIYVDGDGAPGSDDHDTCSFMNLTNVSLINNGDSGFKAIKTRPSGINFFNCELRANGRFGYHGGGASVNFYGGSITLNGGANDEGGLYITSPESGALPRGFGVKDTTFEANYNFDIWVGNLANGVISGAIFTTFENPSWTSTTKSIIKILESGTTDNECKFTMEGCRVNQWTTTGQPVSFVRSNSNFGKLRVKETNTAWAGGLTQEAMQRYAFGSLDASGWKLDLFQKVTLPNDDGTITNITQGTEFFTNSDSAITAAAVVDDDSSFAYSGGTFRCIKPDFYKVRVSLPITGLSSVHSGITLDIRVGGEQVAARSRMLPIESGQFDVPIGIVATVFIPLGVAPTFVCRINGATTNPVDLERNGNYLFSVESV